VQLTNLTKRESPVDKRIVLTTSNNILAARLVCAACDQLSGGDDFDILCQAS